jgi:hypothetical protein
MRPTHNQSELKAIKAEAQSLVATHPIKPKGWVDVPKSEWPPVIASLQPYSVTVHTWGVDISIKPYFDGGWGYAVSRNKRDLPMLEKCWSEPGQGVFWHGPC